MEDEGKKHTERNTYICISLENGQELNVVDLTTKEKEERE